MKNLTDFRKTVETVVDLRLLGLVNCGVVGFVVDTDKKLQNGEWFYLNPHDK